MSENCEGKVRSLEIVQPMIPIIRDLIYRDLWDEAAKLVGDFLQWYPETDPVLVDLVYDAWFAFEKPMGLFAVVAFTKLHPSAYSDLDYITYHVGAGVAMEDVHGEMVLRIDLCRDCKITDKPRWRVPSKDLAERFADRVRDRWGVGNGMPKYISAGLSYQDWSKWGRERIYEHVRYMHDY